MRRRVEAVSEPLAAGGARLAAPVTTRDARRCFQHRLRSRTAPGIHESGPIRPRSGSETASKAADADRGVTTARARARRPGTLAGVSSPTSPLSPILSPGQLQAFAA